MDQFNGGGSNENANEGRDTIYASYNVATLAGGVEQLVGFGGATIGNGNGSDNTLYGNNNTVGMSLEGGAGADLIFGSNLAETIIGGLGNDTMLGLTGMISSATPRRATWGLI